jgi:5'-nucleotidase
VFESRQGHHLEREKSRSFAYIEGNMSKKQILLTNDDGIKSPALWAAAESLSELGFVTVAAPREQSSGVGRSLPHSSDGIIKPETLLVHGKEWTVYAVGGTPAQSVLHAVLEIMPQKPDIVVSGINYGENVATGITISGTVGAVLEAASLGIPGLAMSLEMHSDFHLSYDTEIDFSVAAYFTKYFANALLNKNFPEDMMLLKVDVPSDATLQTPWRIGRLSRRRYYWPVPPERTSWDVPGKIGYRENAELDLEPEDSDVYILRARREIPVVPLSLDMTARVDFGNLDKIIRE